jgi:hypothetical protein
VLDRDMVVLSPSCASDANLSALATWLIVGGAWLSPKLAVTCGENGRGIVAIEPLGAREDVARVPLSLILTNDAALVEDPVLSEFGASGTNLAALGLLRQRAPGRRWEPFTRALPRAYTSTLAWSDSEIEELQASDLVAQTRVRAGAIARHLRALAQKLPPALVPSPADFRWALSLVWSRAHTVALPEGRQGALVPLLDLMNADFVAPSTEAAATVGDHMVVRTARRLAAGEAVTAPYGGGPLSNARALLDYGFCVPDNPHDDVALPLALPACPGDGAYSALDALQLLPPSPPPRLSTNVLLLPPELAATARVCSMPPAEAAAVARAAARNEPGIRARLGAPLSAAADAAAIKYLDLAITDRIGGYATREAGDEAALRDAEQLAANDRMRCALTVRLSEKRILRAHLERLRGLRARDEL